MTRSHNLLLHVLRSTAVGFLGLGGLVGVAVATTSCSSSSGPSGFGDAGGLPGVVVDGAVTTIGKDGGVVVVTPGDATTMMLTGTDSGMMTVIVPVDGGLSTTCPYTTTLTPSDTMDRDGDGWSPADGDCNDCNKFVNPGAYDVPGDGIDQDCSGKADDEVTNCDTTVGVSDEAVTITDGAEGAQAMDLCRTAVANAPMATKSWGVLSADYVLPSGESSTGGNFQLGFGLLGPTFGTLNATQSGVRMLGLSSGTAREYGLDGYQDVGGFDKGYTSTAPAGFPGQTPACGDVQFGQPHDGAAFRVTIRIPTNALTMSFDSNFFSYEFPDYVCSTYNDTYVVIMSPDPAGEPATANHNIAFDSNGNIISINAGFLRVCDATNSAGEEGDGPNAGNYSYACPENSGKLKQTGFGIDTTHDENHASTDWLTTTVSVSALAGQQVTLLFAIWDSSDGLLDSTVLVDNFHWTFATAADTKIPLEAGVPMTMPSQPPK